MSGQRELTCICCPLGCQLTVKIQEGNIGVTGNTCPRGAAYGEKEITSPMRMVTGTVALQGGNMTRLPVKTREAIPKDRIFAVMDQIHACLATAPVRIGEVIIPDCGGTGVDIVACREST